MQSVSETSLENKADESVIKTATPTATPAHPLKNDNDVKPNNVVGGPKFEVPNLDKMFFKKLAISSILIALVFWGEQSTCSKLSLSSTNWINDSKLDMDVG